MFNDYILTNILKHINSGKDYKACCLVSKQFYNIINRLFPDGDVFANHLLTLLKLFPDENWNYQALSNNPNITIDYIKDNMNKDWYWGLVTENIKFTLADMLNNPKIPWNQYRMTYNMNIPANNEEWEFILQHPEYDWKYWHISMHNNLTWDIIINNLDKFGDYISDFTDITTDLIRNNPNLQWDFVMMSENCAVTLDMVNEFINEDWDFDWLAENKKIINHPESAKLFYDNRDKLNIDVYSMIATPEIVELYPNLGWNYNMLSQNHNITYEFIKKHPEINWSYDDFSENHNMNINILLSNSYQNWNYTTLTDNPGIKLTDILNHPELPWDKYYISCRKDLTWRIIANNPHLFDFDRLSHNRFRYEK